MNRLTLSMILSLALALLVALTRLIPTEYRLLNFTAVGAFALFTAARIGLWQSFALTGAAMLISDTVLLWQHGFDSEYRPSPVVYGAMALYALLGWSALKQAVSVTRSMAIAALASVLFFLVTNFASWLSPVHGYEQSIQGLLTCYTAALPFYKGTFLGDVVFTGLIFSAYALWSQAISTPKIPDTAVLRD